VCIKEGNSGLYTDKVHLMQRKLFMDEECLLNYEHGGMEFKDIKKFDKWMARKENMERCLPFPKCIAAFQVRRKNKERKEFTVTDVFINIDLEDMDKLTFLYIRNGEQLYRLNSELPFGEMIFPDTSIFDPQVPMMFDHSWSDIKFMEKSRWEYWRDEQIELKKKDDLWHKENKKSAFSPYHIDYNYERYEELNKKSVYYDDAMKQLQDQINQYNRIALIIQGLLDRSTIFHPHPVIKSWAEIDFQSMIKLIYDGSQTLYEGEKPDFNKYREECNKVSTKDSYFIGQYNYWYRKEYQKAEDKHYGPGHFYFSLPYGNPGPEKITQANKFHKKSQTVTFEWLRERRTYDYYGRKDSQIQTSITVPIKELFNISAYKIGDYKQFFKDPRTREQYLKWAPMLLAAEEFIYNLNKKNYIDKEECI
jgi:hypothetical protein